MISFLLRGGRVNELNFELPSELVTLLEGTIPRPLVAKKAESDNSLVEPESFLLLYHAEASGRVDALVAVPSHAIGAKTPLHDIDNAVEALKQNEDSLDPEEVPLRINNLHLWRGVLQIEFNRGRDGFYSLPIAKMLFEGQSSFIEDTIELWLDLGSGSLIMLKNSFCDVIANMDPFRLSPDFQWSGLANKTEQLLYKKKGAKHSNLLLPPELEHRLDYFRK
jgi:hypothetical protein